MSDFISCLPTHDWVGYLSVVLMWLSIVLLLIPARSMFDDEFLKVKWPTVLCVAFIGVMLITGAAGCDKVRNVSFCIDKTTEAQVD